MDANVPVEKVPKVSHIYWLKLRVQERQLRAWSVLRSQRHGALVLVCRVVNIDISFSTCLPCVFFNFGTCFQGSGI